MASYDSFLFEGHGTSELTGGYDPGATNGGVKENDLADAIVTSALKHLAPTGLSIHRDEQNYIDDDLAGNTYKYKSGIVVHINAGGGSGPEIFPPINEKFLDSDFMITHAISKDLGVANRGVKSRDYDTEKTYQRTNGVAIGGKDYYKEIRQAWEKGISLSILEVGFIDTSDLAKIQANIDLIGRRVAEYIAFNCNATLPSLETPKPTPPTPPVIPPTGTSNGLYRVFVDGNKIGAYGEVSNILKQVEKGLNDKVGKIEIIKI